MISRSAYEALRFQYGPIASWAIWNTDYSDEAPKRNTSDLSVFDDERLLEKINTGYVFVGLNASGKHGDTSQGRDAWYFFHSNYSRQNDYKLRYALQGTKYWGSYITDIIKGMLKSIQVKLSRIFGLIQKWLRTMLMISGVK